MAARVLPGTASCIYAFGVPILGNWLWLRDSKSPDFTSRMVNLMAIWSLAFVVLAEFAGLSFLRRKPRQVFSKVESRSRRLLR